jgi:hypothetical protein
MRIFWIGLGSIAALTFVVVPYIANKQCKNRWPPQVEAFWDFQTGFMVKIQGIIFREENVSVSPAVATKLGTTQQNQFKPVPFLNLGH